MHRQLVLALLLALLLEPATAANPVMDVTLPVTPLDAFYSSTDGILPSLCEICGISLDYCAHALVNPPRRVPTFTVDAFLRHPEWPSDPVPMLEISPEPETELDLRLTPDTNNLPPSDTAIEKLDSNATSILPSTVQVHVENTYLPGDRIRAEQAERRRHSQKRQPPRPGGFRCKIEGCGEAFDRSCDLNRHQKKHLGRYERPHKCKICNEGFLYPKDRNRHQRTHDEPSSPQTVLHCRFPGCRNVVGFSRRDNLLRHQRRQHPDMVASP